MQASINNNKNEATHSQWGNPVRQFRLCSGKNGHTLAILGYIAPHRT